jgi:hypothetical protein
MPNPTAKTETKIGGAVMRRIHCASFVSGIPLLALIFSLAACSGDSAPPSPPSGTVAGVVTDIATGAPLANVTVSDGTASAMTDSNGKFALVRPIGDHTLTATLQGYESTSQICSIALNTTIFIDWALTPAHAPYVNYSGVPPSQRIPAANAAYSILAWNDLGMHCMQSDYASYLILPPFNTLHVQVIKRGFGIMTSSITVSYAFPNKTNSALHTNFWNFSSNYQYRAKYGWNATPNVGITGTPLAGTMTRDANKLGFVATGIPITPYDDNGTLDPYGTATITVTDNTSGAVLATTSVVAPVSSEVNCGNCHGGANPFPDILQAHDNNSGTALVADQANGVLHLCAECHADNALGLPGKPGVENLSLAIHNFHKDKMDSTAVSAATTPVCYNCHPGPLTNSLRGIMAHAGKSCQDCHGDMNGMAFSLMSSSLGAGRKPWLQEPRCSDCHDSKHQENPAALYRNSVLTNAPGPKMNGQLYCEGCHNSTHAEFTSTNAADNIVPQLLQGDNYWIWNCYVCHNAFMPMPSLHQ